MTEDELIEPTGDFKELAAFLDSEDAPEDWMPAAVLDGYLAGVAASPKTMYPHTWLPKIWGDTPFQSEDQAHWMLAAVMSRFNYINQFARGEDPGPLCPCLDSHPDGGPVVRGWAVGFVCQSDHPGRGGLAASPEPRKGACAAGSVLQLRRLQRRQRRSRADRPH